MTRKGFTLIELLVVIAIIGILSSIVLVSVNSARNKAKDTAIKGGLDQLRIAGEMAYDTAGNYSTACTNADAVRILANVVANGGTTTCNVASGNAAYAAQSTIITSATTYYCVDSTGFSGTRVTALGTGTVCPGS
jgi:prepilin-type N-terminal cleavage/methylation domain-containing protein